jgi:hypothetical protein
MRLQAIATDASTALADGAARFLSDLDADLALVEGTPEQWDGESYVIWFPSFPDRELARIAPDRARRFAAHAVAIAVGHVETIKLVKAAPIAGAFDETVYTHWIRQWPTYVGGGLLGRTEVADAIGVQRLVFPSSESYAAFLIPDAGTPPELVMAYLREYDRVCRPAGNS